MQGLLARLRAASGAPKVDIGEVNGAKEGCSDGLSLSTNGFTSDLTHERTGKLINNTSPSPTVNTHHRNGVTKELTIDNLQFLSEPAADDSVVIDIVMASNGGRNSARSRGFRSGTSSPKPTMKSSRTVRGSRVSLNSTSERDDVSVISDDDGTVTNSHRTPAQHTPAQAWAMFEDAVKNIDNGNPEYFIKKPKPNFLSSGTFQQVMMDMYGNTEYGNTKGYTILKKKLNNMARASTLASRMMAGAIKRGQEEREQEEELSDADDEPDDAAEPEHESVTQVFAKRGWKLLKRQVNDTAMEHKTQNSKLNWVMLQHTVKQMTNTQKTRQDLYERYGILPTTLKDGTQVCENRMLSERARAQLYHGHDGDSSTGTHEVKRPSSYQPPSVHLRSRSQLSYKSITSNGTAKTAKLPRFGNTRKPRPKTAK